MNAMRDSLIALFFASMLGLMVLRVSATIREHVIRARQHLTTQEKIHVITDIIESDFRKIGHGLVNPFGAIRVAGESRIIFSYDQNPGSKYDSIRVEYLLLNATATPNPRDKLLIRRVNGTNNKGAALGITNFKLRYFNGYGVELSTPVVSDSLPKIREIEIAIDIQSTEGFNKKYAGAKYVTRIIPKNLLIKY